MRQPSTPARPATRWSPLSQPRASKPPRQQAVTSELHIEIPPAACARGILSSVTRGRTGDPPLLRLRWRAPAPPPPRCTAARRPPSRFPHSTPAAQTLLHPSCFAQGTDESGSALMNGATPNPSPPPCRHPGIRPGPASVFSSRGDPVPAAPPSPGDAARRTTSSSRRAHPTLHPRRRSRRGPHLLRPRRAPSPSPRGRRGLLFLASMRPEAQWPGLLPHRRGRRSLPRHHRGGRSPVPTAASRPPPRCGRAAPRSGGPIHLPPPTPPRRGRLPAARLIPPRRHDLASTGHLDFDWRGSTSSSSARPGPASSPPRRSAHSLGSTRLPVRLLRARLPGPATPFFPPRCSWQLGARHLLSKRAGPVLSSPGFQAPAAR
jgi:hypothetical protein